MQIIPELIPSLLMVIPFLVSFALIRLILWPALAEFIEAREAATIGARAEAERLSAQADQRAEALEAKLAEARKQIQSIHTAARGRAMAAEADLLAAARAKAEEYVAEGQSRIADERLAAKAELTTTAHALSRDIADTLLA